MNKHACTIIYSMYRVDALRTPSRLRAGYTTLLQWRGRYDFFQAQDQPSVTTQVRVGNRVFSHSLDVVSKMYIHIHIDHLWDELGRMVYRRDTLPTNVNELRQVLIQEWQRVDEKKMF